MRYSTFNIGSGVAYQIYLVFRCTKASTSLITSHINNTHAQILKCITHAISFKGNHYNPTLVAFKTLYKHSQFLQSNLASPAIQRFHRLPYCILNIARFNLYSLNCLIREVLHLRFPLVR